MLWFNQESEIIKKLIEEFQYILCCGSTTGISQNQLVVLDFNTSYVVVQHHPNRNKEIPKRFQYILCCGSTGKILLMRLYIWNFNTSYVVVQRRVK